MTNLVATPLRVLKEVQQETLDPHDRLMLAVLQDAITTFQLGLESPSATRRKHFHEVADWFRSRDSDAPFAFENICHVLGIDPDYLRVGLVDLRRRLLHSTSTVPITRLRRGNSGADRRQLGHRMSAR